MNNEIHYNRDSVLGKAMRRVRDNYPAAYAKLLGLRWEWSRRTKFGATNGITLRLNPTGIEALKRTTNPVGHTAFLLLHEALHALLNHGSRLADLTNHSVANRAADYIINAMIDDVNKELKAGLGYTPFPILDSALLDRSKSGNKSVKDLYTDMMCELNSQAPAPSPSPSPSPDKGEGAGEPDQSAVDKMSGQSDKELLDGFAGSGSVDTYKPTVDVEDKSKGLTDQDLDAEIERDNEKIMLTEKMNAQASGTGHTGVRQIESNRQAREGLRWDEHLSQWLTARSDRGWSKPFNHIMFQSTGLVCPARGSRSIDELVIGVDVSGSISEHVLARIMGSIEEAMEIERPKKIYIVAFSHKVTEVVVIEGDEPIPRKLKGGGGTMFQPVWDWVYENCPQCDGIVMLTDMYAFDWLQGKTSEPSSPVLFVSYGMRSEDIKNLPYGEVVNVTIN